MADPAVISAEEPPFLGSGCVCVCVSETCGHQFPQLVHTWTTREVSVKGSHSLINITSGLGLNEAACTRECVCVCVCVCAKSRGTSVTFLVIIHGNDATQQSAYISSNNRLHTHIRTSWSGLWSNVDWHNSSLDLQDLADINQTTRTTVRLDNCRPLNRLGHVTLWLACEPSRNEGRRRGADVGRGEVGLDVDQVTI